jgi:putative ribosome biogenesis GTPase RsgA
MQKVRKEFASQKNNNMNNRINHINNSKLTLTLSSQGPNQNTKKITKVLINTWQSSTNPVTLVNTTILLMKKMQRNNRKISLAKHLPSQKNNNISQKNYQVIVIRVGLI